MDRELLKGSTPLLLLSLLCEGPMYGYQIIETVRQRTGGTYTLKEGALYPAPRVHCSFRLGHWTLVTPPHRAST